mmetsp:Transcript_1991/g.4965  ORF Transcript_1991/g.4965 Transcript_1991/m.4965 type:complete len:151 (-) Transcript_1991:512-964(-)
MKNRASFPIYAPTIKTLRFALMAFALATSVMAPAFASDGCHFSTQPESGTYGGFQWYYGILHQVDPETGKNFSANKAVTVPDIRDCPQVCLNEPGCSAVTYRLTSSGQCLLFAGYDFETNRHMALKIHHSGETSTSSALVRAYSNGPICQ